MKSRVWKAVCGAGIVFGLGMWVIGGHLDRELQVKHPVPHQVQCSRDTLSKAEEDAYVKMGNQERTYQQYVLSCRQQDTVRDLPVVVTEVELPALVTITFGCSQGWKGFHYSKPEIVNLSGECTVLQFSNNDEISVNAGPRDWPLLARMLGLATMFWEKELDITDYEKRAFFTAGFWQPRHMSNNFSLDVIEDESGLNLVIDGPWMRLKSVTENEEDMKKVGEALLPLTKQILIWGSDDQLRRWLPFFMEASYADFAALQMEVWKDDKAHDKKWVDDNGSYLMRNKQKPEGWFMRRWMQAGRSEAGMSQIVIYRFWMTRLAEQLRMPEADLWSKKVRSEIASSTIGDKKWYLKRL